MQRLKRVGEEEEEHLKSETGQNMDESEEAGHVMHGYGKSHDKIAKMGRARAQ